MQDSLLFPLCMHQALDISSGFSFFTDVFALGYYRLNMVEIQKKPIY
jgi:hypothetical protein